MTNQKVFTFYSYKGGVGRSMAMANIAELLYRQGKRVIIVDWDLEAPGLESFFFKSEDQLNQVREQPGLIDMLETYKLLHYTLNPSARVTRDAAADSNIIKNTLQQISETLSDSNGQLSEEKVKTILADSGSFTLDDGRINRITTILRKYMTNEEDVEIYHVEDILLEMLSTPAEQLTPLTLETLSGQLPSLSPLLYSIRKSVNPEEKGGLWLLPAGKRDGTNFASYVKKVQDFDWAGFYEDYNGAVYFDWLRNQLADSADVVLIDSRTGVTEMGGVCTRHISDTVVLLTPPNAQNIAGVCEMIRSITRNDVQEARGRSIDIIVIPSRIDNYELMELNRFKDEFFMNVGTVLGQDKVKDFWKLQIPYIPFYTYHEDLVAGAAQLDSKQLKNSQKSEKLEQAYLEICSFMLKTRYQPLPEKKEINPFPGSLHYTTEEAPFFFGRTQELQKMMDVLFHQNLLIVTGPYGSGKTSTVNAGLLPLLSKNKGLQPHQVSLISLRPGYDSVYYLAQSLDNPEEKKVIFVDQVEEIFLQSESARKAFFTLLNNALENSSRTVILSIRSEYYKELTRRLEAKNTENARVNLHFLSDSEIKRIVLEATTHTDLSFEPGLVERIVKDIESLTNKLPAIQFILSKLWLKRKDRVLTHAVYDEITRNNFLHQVLTYSPHIFTDDQAHHAKPIITRLVNIQSQTCQPLDIEEYDLTTINTLKPFVDSGYLTLDNNVLTNKKTVNLSHNSLINGWPLLKGWLDSDREFYQWREQFSLKAAKWKENGKRDEDLLQGNFLAEAKEWRSQKPDYFLPDEISFINQSIDLKLKKKNRKTLWSFGVLGLIIMGIIAYVVINNMRRNDEIKQFKKAMLAIDTLTGEAKRDSICSLARRETRYNDKEIAYIKDSLLRYCYRLQGIIDGTTALIDSNKLKLESITYEVVSQPYANKDIARLSEIDSLVNYKSEAIKTVDDYQKTRLRIESDSLENEAMAITRRNPTLKEAYNANQTIANQESKKDSIINSINLLTLSGEENKEKRKVSTGWFKEGYILRFGNIRLTLNNLYKEEASIYLTICAQANNYPCKRPLFDNVQVSINNPYNFSYNGVKYRISLTRIGQAGVNPFKQAAYISFEEYERN
jgi:MinD-like ATPase involved in chromosome partitioning or flagellar assembly